MKNMLKEKTKEKENTDKPSSSLDKVPGRPHRTSSMPSTSRRYLNSEQPVDARENCSPLLDNNHAKVTHVNDMNGSVRDGGREQRRLIVTRTYPDSGYKTYRSSSISDAARDALREDAAENDVDILTQTARDLTYAYRQASDYVRNYDYQGATDQSCVLQ